MSKGLAGQRIALLAEENGPEACWPWRWAMTPRGYGYAMLNGRMQPVHRIAYQTLVGPIPDGLHLDHLCRNPSCVNPAHLEPVTARTNHLRGESFAAANARKTHCKRGHDLTNPDNYWRKTYRKGCTQRICKACKRADNRERYHRRSA